MNDRTSRSNDDPREPQGTSEREQGTPLQWTCARCENADDSARGGEIHDLIDASSFGSEAFKAARRDTPPEVTQQLLAALRKQLASPGEEPHPEEPAAAMGRAMSGDRQPDDPIPTPTSLVYVCQHRGCDGMKAIDPWGDPPLCDVKAHRDRPMSPLHLEYGSVPRAAENQTRDRSHAPGGDSKSLTVADESATRHSFLTFEKRLREELEDLIAYVRRLEPDRDLADEIAADAVLAAYKQLSKGDVEHLRAYLRVLARHLIVRRAALAHRASLERDNELEMAKQVMMDLLDQAQHLTYELLALHEDASAGDRDSTTWPA
jgi:hypothetical protein